MARSPHAPDLARTRDDRSRPASGARPRPVDDDARYASPRPRTRTDDLAFYFLMGVILAGVLGLVVLAFL